MLSKRILNIHFELRMCTRIHQGKNGPKGKRGSCTKNEKSGETLTSATSIVSWFLFEETNLLNFKEGRVEDNDAKTPSGVGLRDFISSAWKMSC